MSNEIKVQTTGILLSGALGRMGRAIAGLVEEKNKNCPADSPAFKIVCGVDALAGASSPAAAQAGTPFPVYKGFEDVPQNICADVIIDFSHYSLTRTLLEFAVERRIPLVLCTTAIQKEDLALADKAAEVIPVFRSANMSVGIALVKKLIRESEAFLGDDFDVEIVLPEGVVDHLGLPFRHCFFGNDLAQICAPRKTFKTRARHQRGARREYCRRPFRDVHQRQ